MTDVCLLLEGTYPYVAGGVSTWVYELIKRMRDTTFSVVYLGPHRSAVKKMHYDIPENVTDFREYYIFDYRAERRWGIPGKKRLEGFRIIKEFLEHMRKGDPSGFEKLLGVLKGDNTSLVSLDDLVYSFNSWKVLEGLYSSEPEEVSFIDYFWTWRFIYLPFFSLMGIDLPEARLYHSVSTGYAGVLGVMAKCRRMRPFLLTEHGIYTRERKIEISRADWIYSDTAKELKVTAGEDFFKDWWISLFSFFSRLAYSKADEIITLFEGNRLVQIAEGADPAKTRVIPNGVDFARFSGLKKDKKDNVFRIGFMGRVVPIKDVKSFIKACRIISDELKNVEVYIMGPTDEDEDYYTECARLVEMESLEGVVRFTGKVKVFDYYSKIDVIVLTSVSEGQPMVILEAFASGIPCVATNVGSCQELIHGSSPDDRLLGPAGIITSIRNPEETAAAVTRILKDNELYRHMSEAGRRRAVSYYQMDDLISRYDILYSRYTEEVTW